MNTTPNTLLQLQEALIKSEEDRLWQRWTQHKGCSRETLSQVIQGEFAPGHKARALTIGLSPSPNKASLMWNDRSLQAHGFFATYFYRAFPLEGLSTEMLLFVAALIDHYCWQIARRRKQTEDNAAALDTYNKYRIELLALLPLCAERDAIFSSISLNEVQPFFDEEAPSSGYGPFGRIIADSRISILYKHQADRAMRGIIAAELEGKSTPRREWEEALHCYAHYVQRSADQVSQLAIPLLADQLYFIISQARQNNRELVDGYHLPVIWNLLSGSEYRIIRHEIARSITLESQYLTIYNKPRRELFQSILNEFPEDKELSQAVQEKIDHYDNNQQKEIEIVQRRAATAQSLAAAMNN